MKNLKEIRLKLKESQLKLALEIGVQQETISAYENGKAMPTIETLLKLCKHFNFSSDYLLDLTGTQTPINDLLFNNLNEKESKLILKIRSLKKEDRYKVDGFVEALNSHL